MSSAIEQYRLLVAELRVARMRGDETAEDEAEESMLVLWDDLTEAEQHQTETFAWEAFPEQYLARTAVATFFMEPTEECPAAPRVQQRAA